MWWAEAPRCEFDGTLMETETKLSEFPNGEKVIAEQVLDSEEINKSKGVGQSGITVRSVIRVGKLTIRIRSFEM